MDLIPDKLKSTLESLEVQLNLQLSVKYQMSHLETNTTVQQRVENVNRTDLCSNQTEFDYSFRVETTLEGLVPDLQLLKNKTFLPPSEKVPGLKSIPSLTVMNRSEVSERRCFVNGYLSTLSPSIVEYPEVSVLGGLPSVEISGNAHLGTFANKPLYFNEIGDFYLFRFSPPSATFEKCQGLGALSENEEIQIRDFFSYPGSGDIQIRLQELGGTQNFSVLTALTVQVEADLIELRYSSDEQG